MTHLKLVNAGKNKLSAGIKRIRQCIINQSYYQSYYVQLSTESKIKKGLNPEKNFFNTMIYMIFQYGWESVLIQRILIGFEAILEMILFYDSKKIYVEKNLQSFLYPPYLPLKKT